MIVFTHTKESNSDDNKPENNEKQDKDRVSSPNTVTTSEKPPNNEEQQSLQTTKPTQTSVPDNVQSSSTINTSNQIIDLTSPQMSSNEDGKKSLEHTEVKAPPSDGSEPIVDKHTEPTTTPSNTEQTASLSSNTKKDDEQKQTSLPQDQKPAELTHRDSKPDIQTDDNKEFTTNLNTLSTPAP
ncbi:unnamed protein product, partial [Didymodactylos carnosus]